MRSVSKWSCTPTGLIAGEGEGGVIIWETRLFQMSSPNGRRLFQQPGRPSQMYSGRPIIQTGRLFQRGRLIEEIRCTLVPWSRHIMSFLSKNNFGIKIALDIINLLPENKHILFHRSLPKLFHTMSTHSAYSLRFIHSSVCAQGIQLQTKLSATSVWFSNFPMTSRLTRTLKSDDCVSVGLPAKFVHIWEVRSSLEGNFQHFDKLR